MGQSDGKIGWLPVGSSNKLPTRRQRLNWLLEFGQMSKEELKSVFMSQAPEEHLKFFQVLVENLYGCPPLWTWEEEGEVKFLDSPPPAAEVLVEVFNLTTKAVLRAYEAVKAFIEDTLIPLKKGSETIVPVNTAVFCIWAMPDGRLIKTKHIYTRGKLWSPKPVNVQEIRADVDWQLSELLHEFPLDEIKVCEECGRLYVPLKKPRSSKYCSKKCQNRAAWVRHKIKQATKKRKE